MLLLLYGETKIFISNNNNTAADFKAERGLIYTTCSGGSKHPSYWLWYTSAKSSPPPARLFPLHVDFGVCGALTTRKMAITPTPNRNIYCGSVTMTTESSTNTGA